MNIVNVDLRKFKKAKVWRKEDAPEIFPSDGSWEWFKRTHRPELIHSGALVVRTGRSGDLVHTDRIGPVIQRILVTESLKRIEPAIAA